MSEQLSFKLFKPKQHLSTMIQALWSISLSPNNPSPVTKWLHSDACSGLIFNLHSSNGSGIKLGQECFTRGVISLPISKKSQTITLLPGAKVVGIRFHPGVSAAVLGKIFAKARLLNLTDEHSIIPQPILKQLYQQQQKLNLITGQYGHITCLYRWLSAYLDDVNQLPSSLNTALTLLKHVERTQEISQNIPLSQRQIERQFQQWLDMSPKHYQRILRVKRSLNSLKQSPQLQLADLAINAGFSDQAHMTREFKAIAQITPKKYANGL